MRVPTIIFCCGVFMIATISLVVRDVVSVRALSLLALAVWIVPGIVFARKAVHRQAARAALLVETLVLLGLAFTNAPLRAAFAAFEPRFDAVGDGLLRGDRPAFPLWIGPFRLIDGGIRDGSGAPYFMTSGQPYEINGFVRDPKGTSFNLWSITPVSESWAYIEED